MKFISSSKTVLMIKFTYIFAGFLFISCASSKKASQELDSIKGIQIGVVHLESACGAIISTQIDGVEMRLYPVNLGNDFKKEGIKISFQSIPSRAMQPENCKVDRVVCVENVEKITR